MEKDKELLLKDLCARSPYGVICSIYRVDDLNVGWRDEKLSGYFYDGKAFEFYFGETPISIDNDISKVRPYLRPMSSMTEEERKEYNDICKNIIDFIDCPKSEEICFPIILIDWLNSHHFDYRGLIPMDLALEAPKDMYNV